jgi:hypothetical protein
MKLTDLTPLKYPASGDYPIYLDFMMPRGWLVLFNDVGFIQQYDDEIKHIVNHNCKASEFNLRRMSND